MSGKVDFITGWQAIGAELGVSYKTAKRYHKEAPMPITYIKRTPTTTRDKLQAWANNPASPAKGEGEK